jgi:hypothetical protein
MSELTNVTQMQYATEGSGQADTRKWAQQSAATRLSAGVPARKQDSSGTQKKSASGSSSSKKSK